MRGAGFKGGTILLRGAVAACAAFVVVGVLGCTRPPLSGGPPPPPPPGRVGPVAFDTFVQDRPAIAGKWYDYNDQDHSVTPKQQAWIVSDPSVTSPSSFAAFRITSGYDPNTAALGVFTLSIATFDGTTWSSEAAFTATKNIQDGADDCVNLFTASEVDCASTTWQLRLSAFQYFAPSAGIAIKDPGLFVRSLDGTDAFGDVKIARLDAADLSALPDPTALADLADAPPSSFASTDWDFAKLGADLPRAGMAIGSQLGPAGAGDVWWLMTSRFSLLKLTIDAIANSQVTFHFASVDVDRTDNSAPKDMPALTSVAVDVPAVGAASFVDFRAADLHATTTGTWPFTPPASGAFDLAIEQPASGDVRILLSPDAAIANATKLSLDTTHPPVDTTNTP